MEAKEKAEELLEKFASRKLFPFTNPSMDGTRERWGYRQRIEMAIISVDEILELCEKEFDTSIYSPMEYWQKVKTELEKMK
ncbi:hypothetical protein CMU07_09150 [Elizabethkingia anophelis]|nr:hypothetical protein [Elizabethkingia anophelis]MDV3822920.1 hypothetical protein [Elizabethkingia anophelis]